MALLLRLAVRNLRRNPRRTGITMAGIALGLMLMGATATMQNGSHQDMLRTAVGLLAGHVVVQAPGHQADPDKDGVLRDSTAVALGLREAFPDAVVTRRLYVNGLLSSPSGTTAAAVRGVEPGPEAEVVDLDERMVSGAWLADDDAQGLLLGESMAKSLGVAVGDKVVFMAQPEGDEVLSRLFRVRGTFRTGTPELDGFVAVATVAGAQGVYTSPDPATQVALHLPDAAATRAATAEVRRRHPTLEVLPWQDAIPDIREFVELDKFWSDVMWLVLGVIVSMGVVNTVLMSVLERVREFGIMMAVGLRPGRLAAMVLMEGLVLGTVAAFLGLGLALLASWPIVTQGIDYRELMGADAIEAGGVPMSMLVKGVVDWKRMAVYPLVGVLFALLASLYPAWKVATLRPVDAIHHR